MDGLDTLLAEEVFLRMKDHYIHTPSKNALAQMMSKSPEYENVTFTQHRTTTGMDPRMLYRIKTPWLPPIDFVESEK